MVGATSGRTVQAEFAARSANLDNIVSQYEAPAPNQRCALVYTGSEYHLYSPAQLPGYWFVHELERITSAEYRPTSRRVVQIADSYHVIYDGFTLGGTFGNDGADTANFIGAYYKSSTTTGAYVEKDIVVAQAPALIEVSHGIRDSCNHIAVTIDGAGTLVNLLPTNGSGEKYIDAYTASSTLARDVTAVAIINEPGTYTIRLTNSTQKNVSAAAGSRFYPNALIVSGGSAGMPFAAQTMAPPWVTGEAVLTNYQRTVDGVNLRATAGGTTGASKPSAAGGSDGAVTWAVTAPDNYRLVSDIELVDVSEPWFAIWMALNGQTEEDFGGDIHGGTTLDTLTVLVDGREVTPTAYVPLYGSTITIRQKVNAAHTAAPATTVATFTIDYTVAPGGDYRYKTEMKALYSGLIGLFYPGMLPMYAYLPSLTGYRVRRCLVPSMAPVKPNTYAGQANPKYGELPALQLACLSQLGVTRGSGGVPAADQTGDRFVCHSLEMTRDSMLGYANTGATAYWDMNTSGVDARAGGFTGHLVKGYFRANDGSVKIAIAANQKLIWEGVYRSRMFLGQAGDP